MKVFEKTPTSELDYLFDWRLWLNGDTISQEPVITPTGGAVIEGSTYTPEGVVSVWVSGGSGGAIGYANCAIVTVEGRKDNRTARFDFVPK